MCDDDPLPAFHDRAPPDRYCDLILTGGVTSAIAYPSAIFALATAYRFNAIGGSSSGAGSAALAAAAEYRRRHGSSEGFRILLERTDEVSHSFNRRTGLEWLFQPAVEHLRLFKALVPGFAKADGKTGELLKGVAAAYAVPWLAGVVLFAAAFLGLLVWLAPQGPWAIFWTALLGALVLVFGLVLAVWLLWRDVARVVETDYGLCSGLRRVPGAPRPPLTEWLHALIQELAGLSPDGSPLSFADLAQAPGSPRDTMGDLSEAGAQSIKLQMFTANVTHGRPYVLPLKDEDAPLYFKPREMRCLFPDSVVQHMMDHSEQQLDAAPNEDSLWRLPTAQLPIVVAARMSVSFPVLFMAVPFWAPEGTGTGTGTGKPLKYKRCLFADGSLCSNFPIHLFDSLVPPWPTFGISLHKLPKVEPGAAPASDEGCCQLGGRSLDDVVALPSNHHDPVPERWNFFDDKPGQFGRLKGFIGAMFDTTTDWKDAAQARLLGVRDRVVRVGLPADVGGLNIRMNRQQIRCLAELGGEAARKLLKRFAQPSSAQGVASGWAEHRWVRFNLLRECLSSTLSGLTWSADQAHHAEPLREQIRRAIDEAPLQDAGQTQLLAAQAAALQGVLDALKRAERTFNAATIQQPPLPPERPALQIRPQL